MFDYLGAHQHLVSLRTTKPTIAWLEKQVGGLSKPSKMPWYGYSLPARMCHTGGVLRGIENSVCSKCYARKGRYVFKATQAALNRRYVFLLKDTAKWAANMVALLELKAKGKEQYFRWHDSGDVQDLEHLQAIIWIAEKLPHVRFWLPTKEYALFQKESVRDLVDTVPNLTVRISAPMIGQYNAAKGYSTSTVGCSSGWVQCPAKQQDGKCKNCRFCWDEEVHNVNYPLH